MDPCSFVQIMLLLLFRKTFDLIEESTDNYIIFPRKTHHGNYNDIRAVLLQHLALPKKAQPTRLMGYLSFHEQNQLNPVLENLQCRFLCAIPIKCCSVKNRVVMVAQVLFIDRV